MFPGHVVLLAMLTAVATVGAAALTAFVPGVLTGPAMTNGNAIGTALVMLLGGTPLLIGGTLFARRGSWRGAIVAVGALGYLLYNDVLLVFATPFNRLFLLYEAAFALTLFTSIAALTTLDFEAIAGRIGRLPARGLATYGWIVIGLNVLAWLGSIGPAMLAEPPTSFLRSLGVATNPVIAEDFAFWLPGSALVAWLLWRGRAIGVVLFGAWLIWGLVESIGVAVDQTMGYLADPIAAAGALGGVAIFVVLAVVGLVPLWIYLRPRGQADARTAMMLSRT
jgi:hypothetical protein